MCDLFRPFDVTETAFRVRTERLGPRFNVSGRHVVERHRAETVSVIQIEHAELGSADARRALQHGFEYRFEVARRGGNDLQDIGRRSLLLSRLRQFAGKKGDLLLQVSNRGAASAHGCWRALALRPRRLGVPRCCWFSACIVPPLPSHLALPWINHHTIPYHTTGAPLCITANLGCR